MSTKNEVKILINARDNATRKIESVAKGIHRALTAATIGVAGFGVGKLVKHAVTIGAKWEQTKVAFETMLGSGAKASKLLKDLTEFSTRTPFEPEEVIRTAKTLIAFGFEADKVNGIIQKLGDVSSGTGKDLTELGRLFGKIFVKGKAQAEELNQFVDAGIPIFGRLKNILGKNKQEIFDLASKSKVSFNDINRAFDEMTSKGGRFFNMMQLQSGTTIGKWSTLKGNFDELAKSLGTKLLPTINKILTKLNQVIQATPQAVLDSREKRREKQEREADKARLARRKKSALELRKLVETVNQRELGIDPKTTEKLSTKGLTRLRELVKGYKLVGDIAAGEQTRKVNVAKPMPLEDALKQIKKEQGIIEEQKKKENPAAKSKVKAQEKINSQIADRTRNLKEQIKIQDLLNKGKEREAFIQRELNTANRIGTLTDAQRKNITQIAGTLFDSQNRKQDIVKKTEQARSSNPQQAFNARFLTGLSTTNRPAEKTEKNTSATADNTKELTTQMTQLITAVKAGGFGVATL